MKAKGGREVAYGRGLDSRVRVVAMIVMAQGGVKGEREV